MAETGKPWERKWSVAEPEGAATDGAKKPWERKWDTGGQGGYEKSQEGEPTWGETFADMGKAGTAGTLTGAASMVDLPSDLTQLVATGISKGGGMLTGEDWMSPETIAGLDFSNAREHMSSVTGGFSDYEPKTTLGKYARTVGEFLPGAVAATATGGGSLAGNVLRGAVAPAIASEAAGSIADAAGMNPGVAAGARVLGAMAGGWGVSKAERGLRSLFSAGPATAGRAENAATLMNKYNIDLLPGQVTGDKAALVKNAATGTGQSILAEQPQVITSRLLRVGLGSPDDIVRASTADEARDRIVGKLLEYADGVNPEPHLAQSADAASKMATIMTKSASKLDKIPDDLTGFVRKIDDAAWNARSIPGSELRVLRTQFGESLSKATNPYVADAYASAINTIDDMVAGAYKKLGREDIYKALVEQRGLYRNYLAMQKPLANALKNNGIIKPGDVWAALYSQDGKAAAAINRPLGELASAAESILKPLAGVAAERQSRTFMRFLLDAMAGGTGAFIGNALYGTPGTILALVGAGGVELIRKARGIARELMMSPTMRNWQIANSIKGYSTAAPGALQNMRSMASGISGAITGHASGGRVGRAAGGRATIDHEQAANRLVSAAERAKRGISEGTKSLLSAPDDHIAHALEMANRSI